MCHGHIGGNRNTRDRIALTDRLVLVVTQHKFSIRIQPHYDGVISLTTIGVYHRHIIFRFVVRVNRHLARVNHHKRVIENGVMIHIIPNVSGDAVAAATHRN